MRQQRSYSTDAIILDHSNMGEADRILTIFTPYKGKMHVVAKGIRRPTSRKSGHLDKLCHSQLQVALGRNLDIVTQAQGIESFLHLRTELWHMACGSYLGELIDRFIEDHTRHKDVYDLLLDVLRALDADVVELQKQREQKTLVPGQEYTRSQLLLRYFEIHILSQIGYEPVFQVCAHCHAELQPQQNGFAASLGGALCPKCSHLWKQSLSVNTLKILRLLQRTTWPQMPRFRVDARTDAEIETVMRGLIRFHLEHDMKSWNFLETLHTAKS